MTDKLPAPPWWPSSTDWLKLADDLRAADLDSLEFEYAGQVTRMVRGAHGYQRETLLPPSAGARAGALAAASVRAPCAGLFLVEHPLGVPCVARPGDRVAAGARLGFMQIACLLVPVLAPVAGVLGDWRVASGTLVGYGTELGILQEEHA
jgi:biotin carboxyl carrier protein